MGHWWPVSSQLYLLKALKFEWKEAKITYLAEKYNHGNNIMKQCNMLV